MRISVVGLGKLGAPLLAVLADKGFETVGLDQNPAFVDVLAAGLAPVLEPGLQDVVDRARSRIRTTTSFDEAIAQTDVTFVVVPTPSRANRIFSDTQVVSAVRSIGEALRRKEGYHLVVIVSTVMPGTTGGSIRTALETASHRKLGDRLGLCYNPEFVALGSVIHDTLHPDLILIGESDPRAGDVLCSIHAKICQNQPSIRRMNFVNAEITKIAVNSYVTTKISFANMISEVCDRLPGADATAVTSAIGCDSRIGGKYLFPALGYGGPCFPRDNAAFSAMASKLGLNASIPEATDSINRRQASRVVELVRTLTSTGTIGVLGLSYKPGSSVTEESQGMAIAIELAAADYSVVAFDPEASGAAKAILGDNVEVVAEAELCAARSDVLVIVTPWPSFTDIPRRALQRNGKRLRIIDCWRILPPHLSEVADILYLGVGPKMPDLARPATRIELQG
jgi:UDPglucose 6-dehydrogenase